MTIKKEDCEKVILTTSEVSLLKSTGDATAYRVGNEYYDFEFTDEENPFGAKFVISERAWTIKKPRTKTEFVKVESDLAWELVKDFEEGVEFYTCSKGLHTSKNIGNLLSVWCDGDLHRKVETEIDERQEFIDSAADMYMNSKCDDFPEFICELFDSGKFKLVE